MAKNDKIVDQYTELESQFILRLPPEPAKVLREALRSGASLKDRFSIKLENDVRKAEVKFDHWYFFARVVDLPCIIESLKTIDSKSTYKTADICQMMVCKEDEDPIQSDEEDKTKQKKKDNVKVDKKYLWPHGITPPMKNVRRRRFRKTLRKKYVEAPEIEKEIKRLLRGDSDAVNVKWEVINEQDEKSKAMGVTVKEEPLAQGIAHNLHSEDNTNVDVAEHDLFGEALSDSEDEETNNNLLALDEDNSRLSCEDSSRLSDSVSLQSHSTGRNPLVTEFRKEMFSQHNDFVVQMPNIKSEIVYEFEQPSSVSSNPEFSIKSEASNSYDFEVGKNDDPNKFTTEYIPESSSGDIRARMEQLELELAELKTRRNNQETEIANIENLALRQRFQHKLDNLLAEQMEKEQQYQELVAILDQQ